MAKKEEEKKQKKEAYELLNLALRPVDVLQADSRKPAIYLMPKQKSEPVEELSQHMKNLRREGILRIKKL